MGISGWRVFYARVIEFYGELSITFPFVHGAVALTTIPDGRYSESLERWTFVVSMEYGAGVSHRVISSS